MTRKEEKYLLEDIEQIRAETHENNIMLKQIIKVINYYISNAARENEHDFGRNVLANMISNIFELNGIYKNKR